MTAVCRAPSTGNSLSAVAAFRVVPHPVGGVVWRALGRHQICLPKEEYAECGPGREHDREADVVPRVGFDREGTEGGDA